MTRLLDPLRGMIEADTQTQLSKLRRGMHFIHVDRPATPGDGIYVLDDEDKRTYAELYRHHLSDLEVVKFVPASGAASRMFKDLQAARKSGKANSSTEQLLERLEDFPFYDALRAEGRSIEIDIDRKKEEGDFATILKLMLDDDHLAMASLPKGLLGFHRYSDGVATAFEEQLKESFAYATGKNDVAKLHFTISAEHRAGFDRLLTEMKEKYPRDLQVDFSYQDPSTDTIALSEEGDPVKTSHGEMLKRPGGHGALLRNLDAIDAELIFVKNVDNVQSEKLHQDVAEEKMALAGICLALREETHELISGLRAGEKVEDKATGFIRKWYSPKLSDATRDKLIEILDRPLRVCGMVVNEGEPGGGPFWVEDRLQIVEKSQINSNDEKQSRVMSGSTHFNPVDLVCSVKGPDGSLYDLAEYVDDDAYITTQKSFEGKEIRVLEHPGLWNGAMAKWNTVFVEVPAYTFSPVKTVFDLLKKSHQP